MSGTRKRVQTASTGDGEIVLCRRRELSGDLHYEAVINGVFLFSTYNRVSERALARLAIEDRLRGNDSLSILIGGLGTGYTLQAALEYEGVSHVTVVEKEKVIVDWSRTYLSPYNGNALGDARVSVVVEDFRRFISSSDRIYDALCVDVDNGPHWTVWEGNGELYEVPGLEKLRRLLAQDGRLTVWSSRESEALERGLSIVFGSFSVHPIRTVELGEEKEYIIYRSPT